MSIYGHIWRNVAHSGQFSGVECELQRTSFNGKEWKTLHNTHINEPVWPHLVNDVHVWSRIWSINDLALIEAEVGNLGLRNQVMTGMERWGNIKQIWPKVS